MFLFFGHSSQHTIKHMIISFVTSLWFIVNEESKIISFSIFHHRSFNYLWDNTRFFQKILFDFCTFDRTTSIKMNVDILSETRRIIIAHGFCISKCFEQRKIVIEKIRIIKKNDDLPSRIGLASRICCSIHECCPLVAARNWRINFVDSVFPLPLSPLIMIHWSCW